MKRRQFLGVLGGAASAGWPLAVRAQQSDRLRQISVLMAYAADDPEARLRVEALEQRLQALGWISGRNLKIEYHWAPGADAAALRRFSSEAVAKAPELIVCNSTPVLAALLKQAHAIPIIFLQVSDPVGSRFVESLARPGGNVTGFTDFEYDIGGKWLGLLKEADPTVRRVAVIVMPQHLANAKIFQDMQPSAAASGVSLVKVETREVSEIERAIDALLTGPRGGLIVLPSPLAIAERELITSLITRGRLPAIFPFRYFTAGGGLMSYGINQVDQWQRAANYVDRVLKGDKPATLPVQQPTKFELVINLKTAKALGLDIPPTLLARADDVIE